MTLYNKLDDAHPPRKILAVVTLGGSSNLAPILDICRILFERGHKIEVATLPGRESLAATYTFVTAVHVVGRAMTTAEHDENYMRLARWDTRSLAGRRDVMRWPKFTDSFWPETYRSLLALTSDAATRPDLIFADYMVEAARDVAAATCLPLAVMSPQMPIGLAPQPWIPGLQGMQTRCLTSEHATMADRLFEQAGLLRFLPALFDLNRSRRAMRDRAGLRTDPVPASHPDHVVLVNSFFGLEPAKPLPPLMMAAGPVLADTWKTLDLTLTEFLLDRSAVAYVAFGTHVILEWHVLVRLLRGLASALQAGHIDGVVWSLRSDSRKLLEPGLGQAGTASDQTIIDMDAGFTALDLIQNKSPHWLFLEFAPQRALLAHPATALFVTHAGASSANEGLWHGVRMLCMGFYFDQIPNSMRLAACGVALALDKHTFSAAEVAAKIAALMRDPDGAFARNVCRLRRIAHVAARRKYAAADLIEEHMYDWGLRFERDPAHDVHADHKTAALNAGRGRELAPMHLQTADARMSWLRATNTDEKLLLLGLCGLLSVLWWVLPAAFMAVTPFDH